MEEIPHSQYTDEARFIKSINSLIDSGTLKSTASWKKSSTDDKASKKRAEKASKSAQEAESHAKELGIWDEMFGTGKKGKRKSDAKDDGEDGLAALILRRQKDREGGLDRLAEKYRKIEEEERAKKVKRKKGKGKVQKDEGGGPPVRMSIWMS
jgi:DnaJ family protein C protein 9